MAKPALKVVTDGSVGDLPAQIRSFERQLRIKNLAPNTIATYVKHARWFAAWLTGEHGPLDTAHLTRDHLEGYILHLQGTVAPATVGTRFRSLQHPVGACVRPGRCPWPSVPRRRARDCPIALAQSDAWTTTPSPRPILTPNRTFSA